MNEGQSKRARCAARCLPSRLPLPGAPGPSPPPGAASCRKPAPLRGAGSQRRCHPPTPWPRHRHSAQQAPPRRQPLPLRPQLLCRPPPRSPGWRHRLAHHRPLLRPRLAARSPRCQKTCHKGKEAGGWSNGWFRKGACPGRVQAHNSTGKAATCLHPALLSMHQGPS